MLSKVFGLISSLIYKLRFGNAIYFKGIPFLITHMKIYIKSGKINIGKNFSLKSGVYIAAVNGGKINIGDKVSFNRNCILVSHDSITVGNNVRFGPNVIVYDHDHKFDKTGVIDGYKTQPIVIEDNCWIGANVIILRNTHIGKGSVIGAGCIVQGIVPAHSLVTSNRELNITPIIDRET